MLAKHVVCNGCGAETLDATFDEGVYCDVEGTFDYSEITGKDITQILPIKNTDWVRHAFRDPEDAVAINFEDYCPDCQ